MARYVLLALFLAVATAVPAYAQEEKDAEGSADSPLLSRMPGFYISGYDVKDFDSYDPGITTGENGPWEGKLTKISYEMKNGAKPVSMVQIGRNYANAIKKIGGKILADEGRVVAGRLEKGGAVTHVEVSAFNDGRDYEIVIVEAKAMEQEVVADAAALNQSIAENGKATVYGIYFDTGKSDVKPESNATLEEIVKMLKSNTSLQLYVVGHTDNVGTLDANLKLSSDRSAAVVKALVAKGIPANRLKPAGVGPYCPVTSNKSDDGKAKNRRVELVAQN